MEKEEANFHQSPYQIAYQSYIFRQSLFNWYFLSFVSQCSLDSAPLLPPPSTHVSCGISTFFISFINKVSFQIERIDVLIATSHRS